MKSLTISENAGLFVIKTSDGRRVSGASLVSTLAKLSSLPSTDGNASIGAHLADAFGAIRSSGGGQIAEGQAAG